MHIISVADADAASAAADVLNGGGIVVLPTDTVYGIAARIDQPSAVKRIFELKARPGELALAVLVADLDEAKRLGRFDARALAYAQRWPGPLTLVVPRAHGSVSIDLGGDGISIGLRIPDGGFVIDVLRSCGPLVATSANPHGAPTPTTLNGVEAAFGDGIDLYVDGGPRESSASEVISVLDDGRVIRERGP